MRVVMRKATLADDIREMMAVWERIGAAVREKFPGASDAQVYRLTAGAMKRSLGLK